MITTGLVSVTFRKLPPREITSLVSQAGLDGIEWGGDVHVPHGDLHAARDVRRMTQDAGLRILAYGSYFRCQPDESFEHVVETAVELGAPLIRVWAGKRSSTQADEAYREGVALQSRRIVALAAQHGVKVAYEFHGDTLTDATEPAVALLRAAPGMHTLWQPPHDVSEAERLKGLRVVLPWLANVHVFHWRMPDRARLPLSEGADLWRERLAMAATMRRDFAALLEFVHDDDPEQFMQDAHTLKNILNHPELR